MDAAHEASTTAFAPWSEFAVGAALLTDSGEVYRGCNVENPSLGLTMCAERVAAFTALAALGRDRLAVRAIAVANREGKSCSPCGACRQVLAELAPGAMVVFQDDTGIHQVPIARLLPHAFDPSE
jgi:cytidine deaminase